MVSTFDPKVEMIEIAGKEAAKSILCFSLKTSISFFFPNQVIKSNQKNKITNDWALKVKVVITKAIPI